MSVASDEMFRINSEKKTSTQNGLSRLKDFNAQLNSLIGLILLAALFSFIAFSIYYLSQPDTLPIKKVHVVGEFRNLSPSRLQTLVTDEVRGGFFNVNVAEVSAELMKSPWVEHVSVTRIWPDTLSVNVKERIAVVRWGEDGLLNANAVHFVPPPATIPADLPVLNGPDGSYKLLLDRYNELSAILNKIDFKLSELNMNERRAWQLKLDTGLVVMIGKSDYAKRVKRFAEVVVKALAGQMDKVKKVDMRYTNGFAIEWVGEEVMPIGEKFDG